LQQYSNTVLVNTELCAAFFANNPALSVQPLLERSTPKVDEA
jgi:hypothetical protein